MKQIIKKLLLIIKKYQGLILYLFFGFVTTGVNFLVYCIGVIFISWNITISNIVAWFLSVLVAYITNKIWVFKSYCTETKFLVREIFMFYIARFASGAFEIVMLPIMVKSGFNQTFFGVDGFVAKLILSIFVVIANYIFSKLAIFKVNM